MSNDYTSFTVEDYNKNRFYDTLYIHRKQIIFIIYVLLKTRTLESTIIYQYISLLKLRKLLKLR